MKTTTQVIAMESSAFETGEVMPRHFTVDGQNVSPPLSWSNLPEHTKELAIIMDDPDAPIGEPWVHWVLYKIPAQTHELPEALPRKEKLSNPAGALQGPGTRGSVGYDGPAPPRGHGMHHYHFKIYALNEELPLEPGMEKNDLLEAMQGHVIGEGEIVGLYKR